MAISGLAVRTGPEAVVIVAAQPLRVLSSAVHGGGLASARAVVNLHVGKDDPCADPAGMLVAHAHGAGLPCWSIAQAARRALWAGIRGWQERNG